MDREGDPEVMLAILEKKAEFAPRFKAAQEAILASQTCGRDWTESDGKMCLSAAGAERVGRLFDIQYFETSWLKEEFTDSVGKGYRYVYECKAALGSRITYAMGVYSSRDAFLGQCDGQYKALEEVDENNIRRAACSLMKGNAIKSLLGLRGIPREEWQEMMQRLGRQAPKATKAQPGQAAPGGPAEANRAKRPEMARRSNKRWKSKGTLRQRRQGELSRLGRRLDWLIAQVTKCRDGWKCQKCGKRLFAHEAHCAHVLPKSAGLLLRWDRHNTILLCFEDHIEWAHGHPVEFREWFQAKFPERFAHLQDCRRQRAKFDEEARRTLIAVLERELRRLGGWP